MAKQLYVSDIESKLQQLLGPLLYELVDNWHTYTNDLDTDIDVDWIELNYDNYLLVKVNEDELTIKTANGYLNVYMTGDPFYYDRDVSLLGDFKKAESFLKLFDGQAPLQDIEKFFVATYAELDLDISEFEVIYEENNFMDDFLIKI